ncbi:MAG TPA: hypothetical protein VH143_01425 [Kofleriaceae bacterium]|jgi:hypothetical protein|nr:hypothetical protein [Kofleriaceae bacterium]
MPSASRRSPSSPNSRCPFCQNGVCASAAPGTLAVGDLAQNDSTGAFVATIDIVDADASGANDPTMSWITAQLEQVADNDVTFHDGDVYTLTVTGVTIAQYDTESVCSFTCQEMTVSI